MRMLTKNKKKRECPKVVEMIAMMKVMMEDIEEVKYGEELKLS